MNLGIILWNIEPLYYFKYPFFLTFKPVHNPLKFLTVLGTTSPNKPKIILPFSIPSIEIVN